MIFGAFEGQVVIGNLATGESFGLAEVAAAMWQGIVRHGNLSEVAAALGREYEVDAATLPPTFRLSRPICSPAACWFRTT